MAGSSAFAFAREAHRSGLMSRREIVADGAGQPRLPAPGLDRPVHRPAARPGRPGAAGHRGARHPAHGAGHPRRGPAPGLSGDAARGLGPPGRGRPVYIVTASSQEMADLVAGALLFDGALGSGWEKADGQYTGRAIEPFTYREGKAVADAGAGGARGLRPARLLRLLGLRVRPAHAARGRQPGRGQPRHRARRASPTRRAGGSCASSACGGACSWPAAPSRRWPSARARARRSCAAGSRRPARLRRAASPMSTHELSDEQREIRALARRFADEEIAPRASRVGPRAPFPGRGLRGRWASSG